MNRAIIIENLGKKYNIRHQNDDSYLTLRDVLVNNVTKTCKSLKNMFSKSDQLLKNPTKEEFWALRNVSFDVNEGDRIGIIGKNGAGKSTLLKLLSKITIPSEGKITLKGRVASLLEVGTGFHPELTGRENIFLNASIIGMTKKEIEKKFDEIVAFSEIEKFLDTPVKRFSSGMYIRLAFAVVAHLEPEIMLIDEVLAVGDVQFQKKCLAKMEGAGKEGRTVIFVSHNMKAIQQFCNKCLLLENGNIVDFKEDVNSVIKQYLFQNKNKSSTEWINSNDQFDNPYFKPLKFYLSDKEGNLLTDFVSNNDETFVNIEGKIEIIDDSLQVGYYLYSEEGNLIYVSLSTDGHPDLWPKSKKGINLFRSQIPKRFLNDGCYRLELIIGLYYKDWICGPLSSNPFIILDIEGELSDSPCWIQRRQGLMAPILDWFSVSL